MDPDRGAKPLKRKLRHRFFVSGSKLSGGGGAVVQLDAETSHHVRDVLRLGAGTCVALFDNSGREYEAEILESKPRSVKVKVLGSRFPGVESPLCVTIAQALLKGNAFDHALTMCTELGVNRFIPVFTSRTVVRLRRKELAERTLRWEKIARAASAQSGRVKVPVVEPPVELAEVLGRKWEGAKIILWEHGGCRQWRELGDEGKPEAVILLAGPEGGFEQAEVKTAAAAGFQIWGLGPRILRAENAGAVALALLQFQFGDMG